VWLSEIMLQQTTVVVVKSYFEKFIRQWPTVTSLAAADREDIMRGWAGLGYYARARRMKDCADIIARDMGGSFPQSADELAKLPGIGPYTAAAIAAIAFDEAVPVVDGNVERVMARLYDINTPLPAAKPQIRMRMADLTPVGRPGDFAQAVMDLGSAVCTPSNPACGSCPWSPACLARANGTASVLPFKAPKKPRPQRHGAAFVVVRDDGAILLRQRPDNGLLGGMAEVPGTTWRPQHERLNHHEGRPVARDWVRVSPGVRHTFTHFHLELAVWRGRASGATAPPAGCWWAEAATIADEALPSVMRKVIEAALPGATRRQPK
jgi:A/G-specific adenine glycosylase